MKYILVINLFVTRIIHKVHFFLHFQPTCLVSVRHKGIFIILAEGDLLLILPLWVTPSCVDNAIFQGLQHS